MYRVIEQKLSQLTLGGPQVHGQVAVVPVMEKEPAAGPEYLMLSEALQQGVLRVTEVSEGGSVPELKVINDASMSVLILDGEELQGAKQNRVVNTTILLKEKSEMVVPVSCTERGRWHYRTREFSDSGVVLPRPARGKKSRSVFNSLKHSGAFRSDQVEVWKDVSRLNEDLHCESPTDAMRDAFESRRDMFKEWLDIFRAVDGQVGLVFLLNGRVLALEFLSRPGAYRLAHDRLVKSYTVDLDPGVAAACHSDPEQAARAFLATLPALAESRFPSCGYGMDYRFENPRVCGSVLVHEETCIHAAFFQDEMEEREQPRMASYRERARHRRPHPES